MFDGTKILKQEIYYFFYLWRPGALMLKSTTYSKFNNILIEIVGNISVKKMHHSKKIVRLMFWALAHHQSNWKRVIAWDISVLTF